MSEWDISSVVWLQQTLGLQIAPAVNVFTELGAAPFTMLFIGLGFWLGGSRLGLRLGFTVLTSVFANMLLKVLLMQPRPYFLSGPVANEIVPLHASDGFGMPSGHAQNAASIWGTFVALVHRPFVRILAPFLIVLIGLSRVYLGVHSPTQVLVGWAVGLLCVVAMLRLDGSIHTRFARLSVPAQLGLIVAVVLALLLVRLTLVASLSSSFAMPVGWAERYVDAQRTEAAAGTEAEALDGDAVDEAWDELTLFAEPWDLVMGALLGLGLCAIYFGQRGGYEIRSPRRRIANVLLGVLVLLPVVVLLEVFDDSAPLAFGSGVAVTLLCAVAVPWLTGRFAFLR